MISAPGTPREHLEMPSLPIEKPTMMSEAREKLRAVAQEQSPAQSYNPAPKTTQRMPAWLWAVAAVWVVAIVVVGLLVHASRSVSEPPPGRVALGKATAHPWPLKAGPVKAKPSRAVAVKQDNVLIIDASGSASAVTEKGDVGARAQAAIKYLKGDGVEADPGVAMRYGQEAATEGDADAQFVVGALYARGMAPDPFRAASWYLRAARQNHPKAMYNLAMAFLTGNGVAKDPNQALVWFTKAADAGYADAAVNLGILYERGGSVKPDRDEALKWYRRAAELGDAEAATRVKKLEVANAATRD
jgi:TPR repeat protein